MNTALIQQIQQHVTRALSGEHETQWPFHNIHHVKLVVIKCIELAQAHKLDQQMTDELLVAAWFHDIGYIHGSTGHEQRSLHMCRSFLKPYNLHPAFVNHISELILSTKYPSHPVNIQEKILCDADLYHLASDNYSEWETRLFIETKHQHDNTLSEQHWRTSNIEFFKNHSYFTDYALRDWTPQKLKNLLALEQQIHTNEQTPKNG